ncbi:hypothetical protein GCM10008933_21490 [Paenibacillus motobuensis]|uniref:Uncharacterized protein n=1 Tax=Paenibacillus motobuensis TaxID=295324 RepID=A0ABP3I4R5_9BACL
MRDNALVDPYYQDIPWDIIYDDDGQPIGEVFVLPGDAKKEGLPYGNSIYRIRRAGCPRAAKV